MTNSDSSDPRIIEAIQAWEARDPKPSVQDLATEFRLHTRAEKAQLQKHLEAYAAANKFLGGAKQPVEAVPPPTRVEQYEVEAEVGRGAFGVVYRGNDSKHADRVVALK